MKNKWLKFLAPTMLLPTTFISLVSCGKAKDEVKLISDVKVDLSNRKFKIGQPFETKITCKDNTRSIQTIEVTIDERHLSYSTEYTYENNILKVAGSSITTQNLTITITSTLKEKLSDETVLQYIDNRTFSLKAYATLTDGSEEQEAYFGTCWIIDDSTPNVHNDYHYYVATNWHVTHAFEYFNSDSYKDVSYQFADKSLISGTHPFIDYANYLDIESFQLLDDDYSSSLYTENDNEDSTEFFKPCIDMVVCDVDFGTPQLWYARAKHIKDKLDFLNDLRAEKGCINRFVNALDTNIISKNKYTAGYPWKFIGLSFEGAFWETESFNTSELDVLNRKGFYLEGDAEPQYGHSICDFPYADQQGNPIDYEGLVEGEEFYYYDISPQYVANEWILESQWAMSGGASGSMIVTEDCEVCGIFWGGIIGIDESMNEWIKPAFSLFKTNDKDFGNLWK